MLKVVVAELRGTCELVTVDPITVDEDATGGLVELVIGDTNVVGEDVGEGPTLV